MPMQLRSVALRWVTLLSLLSLGLLALGTAASARESASRKVAFDAVVLQATVPEAARALPASFERALTRSLFRVFAPPLRATAIPATAPGTGAPGETAADIGVIAAATSAARAGS